MNVSSRSAAPEIPPLLRDAVNAHRRGQRDRAVSLYGRYLAAHPDDPTALQLLGLLHAERGELDAAISLMRASLARSPNQPEVANNLGNALARAGRRDEAIESYTLALQLRPAYHEARRNLGLGYLDRERYADAEVTLSACVQQRPDDAVAWLGLGNVHKRRHRMQPAIDCYEHALALRPDYAEAHHNLGVCLRLERQIDRALAHYEQAQRLGLDRAELHHNIGNARLDRLDLPGAIAAFRTAVERNPEDLGSHANLNNVLSQLESTEGYLDSYRRALAQRPRSAALRHAYAVALCRQAAYTQAERVVAEGLAQAPDSSELSSLLGYVLEEQGRWPAALQRHAAAVAAPGANAHQRVSYARALLACGRPAEALPHAEAAVRELPLNQLALAYLGLCWRALGNPLDAWLNDYERFVRVYDIPAPALDSGPGTFHPRLCALLDRLHVGKHHPPGQTLRGGTQTFGELFSRPEPELQALAAAIRVCVRDYLDALPPIGPHPLLARPRESFEFSGSWSVRLQSGGYHTNHVHPMGWLSSAYYVQVPPEVAGSDRHGGGIQFGQPDIDLGPPGAPRRTVRPVQGRLVLFPSYLWHGTVPFESDQPRTTIAFDIVPGGAARGPA
jgi:tetratricopeptide (TPR) repeat protein